MNSLYQITRQNPPIFDIKPNPREIIFELVSCMCDNISYLHYRRDNSSLRHYNSHCSLAFSNLQCKALQAEVLWAIEDNEFDKVVAMLNTSTSRVFSIKIRG